MASLSENIVNRVGKLPKPGNYAQALQPVFEAISNARFAIFDRFEDDALKFGNIKIVVNDISKPENVLIKVIDNGIGLDDLRYEAFCVVDTEYKKAKGGKGVGRLFWLDAFREISVTSRYGDGSDSQRSFRFLLRNYDQIENDVERELEVLGIGTTVSFHGVRDNEYLQFFPKKADTFIRYFSSHFISDFLIGVSPRIELVIDGESAAFPQAIRDLVVRDFDPVAWTSQDFDLIEITGFLCKIEASAGLEGRHQVHLLADGRTVESRKVDGLIGLGPIAWDEESDLCIHVCVDAPYLNARVNEGRTAFNVPEAQLKKLTREIADKIKETFIQQQVAKYRIERAENYRDFIESYPIFDFDAPEIQLERVPFGANSAEDFAAGLVKIQVRQEESRRIRLNKIVEEICDDDAGDEKFSDAIVKIADELQKSEQLSLAQHVVRRKLVIELLDVLLKRFRRSGDDDDFYLEKTVHSVLCPTGVDSVNGSDLVARSHDLWLIDERLAFSRAFASDKRIKDVVADSGSSLRPDLLVWDIAYGLAYFEAGYEEELDISKPISEMMIIELKRPMRSQYKKYEDNVEYQIIKYINELKRGEVEGFQRDRVRVSPDCIFHCFVVADIVGDLALQIGGWAKTPDGEGRYRPIEGDHRGSITVVQWKDLVNDAWMRNQATLNAAGLRRTSQLISEMQRKIRDEGAASPLLDPPPISP